MRDARLLEFVATRTETVSFVERHRRYLRIDDRLVITPRSRLVDQMHNQRSANAARAPLTNDGHAADVPVSKQARAADWRAFRILRERMNRVGVGGVPFEHFGNALLDDEDVIADATQRIGSVGPSARADSKRLRHTR